MIRQAWLVSASATMIAATLAGPAAGQTAGSASTVEEVIVTATKRSESLQEVPLSVAAVSGEALERANITEISQLQTATPNFSYSGSNNPRGAGITIRGVGTNNFSSAIEGSVGIVVDGVPLGRQGAGFTDFFDVARVEVLRGPQGTLFGKNASAGVLNITTRDPSREFEARTLLSYGEDNELVLRGSVSGPLGDSAGARLSVYRTKRDGYIKNVANGADLNDRDEWGGRAKLRFDLGDALQVTFAGDYNKRSAACCMWTTRSYGANAILRNQQASVGIVARPNNRFVNLNGQVFVNQEGYGLAGQVDYQLGAGYTLTSISAVRWWNTVDNNDADQTTLPILDINNGDSRQKQLTQEVRLTSPEASRVRWVLGAFYFDQDYNLQNAQRGTFGAAVPAGTQLSRQINVANDTLNYAAFGDLTFDLTDLVSLFGGLRYTHEQLDTSFKRAPQPGTLPLGTTVDQVLSRKDNAWTWRVGAQVKPSDRIMAYVSAARGFKGGGFNALQDSASLRTVEPEIPTAYEAGLKTELFERRLRFNVALFQTDFDDFQVQAITTSATGTLTFDVVNAGELRTRGVEIDLSARPLEGLSVDGGAAYTKAEYTDFSNAPCFAGQTVAQGCTGTGATARQNLTGRTLPNAPRLTANVSARYERPLWTGEHIGFAQVSYAWRGRAYTALDLDPRSVQDGYGLLDVQVGSRAENGRYRFSVWVKNLTDERFAESIFDTPLDAGGQSQFIPVTAQRQFGATLELQF